MAIKKEGVRPSVSYPPPPYIRRYMNVRGVARGGLKNPLSAQARKTSQGLPTFCHRPAYFPSSGGPYGNPCSFTLLHFKGADALLLDGVGGKIHEGVSSSSLGQFLNVDKGYVRAKIGNSKSDGLAPFTSFLSKNTPAS